MPSSTLLQYIDNIMIVFFWMGYNLEITLYILVKHKQVGQRWEINSTELKVILLVSFWGEFTDLFM